MTPEELKRRTKKFAVDVIGFARNVSRTDEARTMVRQLLAAGTSVGANYRAVCRARSDAEFVARLGTCIEEADESAYWLELLVETGIVGGAVANDLWREADQLTRIFTASRETVRRRLAAERRARQRPRPTDPHQP